jgi:hypothetical protein
MRVLMLSVLILFSMTMLAPGFAAEDCRCQGCGCKGGPGWRGPDGACVHKAALADICGTPPGAPCKHEAAARTCFGKQSSWTDPKATTQPQ